MLKTLLGVVVLAFAAPALAQPAPAADPHAGHAEHSQASPAQSGHTGHAQHGQAGEQQQQQQQQQSGHDSRGEHTMHCCTNCCGENRQDGEKMSCCDKHGDAAPKGAADHSQHGN